jgi:hypothetical protein
MAGVAAAQAEDPKKEIRGLVYTDATGNLIAWNPAEREPDSYRLSWTIGKKWRSIKKPNTNRAGNMIVPGDFDWSGNLCSNYSYPLFCVRLPDGWTPPKNSTLRLRVRAIYKGEKNGPWATGSITFRRGRAISRSG